MDDLRKEILVTEELVASKRRFGLFSQPPPIAVGDDSVYKPTIRSNELIQIKEISMMENPSPIHLKCQQVHAKLASQNPLILMFLRASILMINMKINIKSIRNMKRSTIVELPFISKNLNHLLVEKQSIFCDILRSRPSYTYI